MASQSAIVGVSDHCGWAVLMTVDEDGKLLDRRRVELIDPDLPKLPHHHECQSLPEAEGVELVERVRASADRRAAECLEALAAEVSAPVAGIAIRRRPPLPPTIAERITNYRAQNVADSVMMRDALADAASARGWTVHSFDAKTVFADAAEALDVDDVDVHLAETGRSVGRPWQKDHKMAMAAAIAAKRFTG